MRWLLVFIISTCFTLEVSDCGRLYHAQVKGVMEPKSVEELQQIIRHANEAGEKVSFAGQRMSQGGHTFVEDGLSIEMRALNRILHIDEKDKTIEVEAGATWEEIQNAINEFGLAIKVMQSSNIFTVGGSLSTNVHGRDPHYGPLIETVRAIKVMHSNGDVVELTHKDPLFSYVIGGYGAFGPIVSAKLELTDNVVYRKEAKVLNVDEYRKHFVDEVLGHREVGLHFARFSLSSRHFLKRMIAVSYKENKEAKCDMHLVDEQNVRRNKNLLTLLRAGQFFKTCRWPMELRKEKDGAILSRNQAMRPPVKCLEFHSKTSSDLLQEYFIPLEQFESFSAALKEAVQKEKINLLNVTVRYVPQDKRSAMPYAKSDLFAFVLYFNHKFENEERTKRFTLRLIDEADRLGGTFYLPYQLYADQKRVLRSYPELEKGIKKKKALDPKGMFTSTFIDQVFKE